MTLRISFVVLLIFGLSISSCAFKGGDPQADGSQPVISAQFAWWSDAGQKSPSLARVLDWHSDQRLARAGLPVTLPVVVPDRFEVELSFPTPLATLDPARVLVEIVGSSGKNVTVNPKQVVVSSQTADATAAIVELEGLRTLLKGVAESSLELRVLVQTADGVTPLTAAFTFRSPPASIGVVQTRASDAALDQLSHADGLRSVSMAGVDYSLMQVVRIHNHSASPIEVQVPPTARAGLKIQRTSYTANALGACGFEAFMEKKSLPLAGDTLLLPITEDLSKRLARQLDAATLGRLTIQPDQEAPVGVYVSGVAAKTILDGHFEKRKADKTKLPDHCEARCDHKRMGANEFPLCWSGGRNGMYGIPAWEIQSCLSCAGGDQKGCEQCSAWENGTGTNFNQAGPNCLFCGELAEVGHFDNVVVYKAIPEWRQDVVYAENVLTGDDDGGITFESDPASALLNLRFADASASDDPVSRQVPFLRASVEQDSN